MLKNKPLNIAALTVPVSINQARSTVAVQPIKKIVQLQDFSPLI